MEEDKIIIRLLHFQFNFYAILFLMLRLVHTLNTKLLFLRTSHV